MPHIFKMFLSFEINLKERPCLVIFIPSLYINGYLPEAKCCCHLPEVKSGDTRGRAEAVHRFVLSSFSLLMHRRKFLGNWNPREARSPTSAANPISIFIENVTLLTPPEWKQTPQSAGARRKVHLSWTTLSMVYVKQAIRDNIKILWKGPAAYLYACQNVWNVMISKFPRYPK